MPKSSKNPITATYLAREARIVEALTAAPKGMRGVEIAALICATYAATGNVLMLARRRGTISFVSVGMNRFWTIPERREELLRSIGGATLVPGSEAQSLQDERKRKLVAAIEGAPAGLSLADVCRVIGVTKTYASIYLKRAKGRGVFENVRSEGRWRWTLPGRTEDVMRAIAAEKETAARAREESDDPLLHRKPVLTRAGDAPPPITSAPRSVFEFAQEAA